MHIGGLRTALYNFLLAHHAGGSFILRIEDTDQGRFVPGSLENIIQLLDQAGLTPDEGVTLGSDGTLGEKGEYGPYIQSKRTDTYRAHVQTLLDNGWAYRCFCTAERLEQMRAQQIAQKLPPHYDRFCRNLSTEEVSAQLAQTIPFVVRLRVPETGFTEFRDQIRGKIRFEHATVDDQVLIKSDGFPTYHFANVIDDHAMQITHVARAEEWLSSTPKHLLLYQAFGWQPPQFAHFSLVINEQRKKLSKRDGDVSATSFLQRGYLMEALLNFVAFLGWNPKTTQEFFSLDELVAAFSLDHVNKSPAVFDIKKLNWINAHYIKQLSDEQFLTVAKPFLEKKGLDTAHIPAATLASVLALEKSRIQTLEEVGEETRFYFDQELHYDPTLLSWKQSPAADTIAMLTKAASLLEQLEESSFAAQDIERAFFAAIEQEKIATGALLWPMRVALTGKQKSPGPFDSAAILGQTRSLARIQTAIEILGKK